MDIWDRNIVYTILILTDAIWLRFCIESLLNNMIGIFCQSLVLLSRLRDMTESYKTNPDFISKCLSSILFLILYRCHKLTRNVCIWSEVVLRSTYNVLNDPSKSPRPTQAKKKRAFCVKKKEIDLSHFCNFIHAFWQFLHKHCSMLFILYH